MTELALVPIAFLTSCLAAVMGMGGGILLIALMPGLVPAAAIIPIHAFTQLASNLSRAAFGWREIEWAIVPAFNPGGPAGRLVGGRNLYQPQSGMVARAYRRTYFAVYLVAPAAAARRWAAGAACTGVLPDWSGDAGGRHRPTGAAVLLRRNCARDWLVVNTAVYMSLNHCLRLLAFVTIGFSFGPWWQLVGAMVLAVIAGSWAGTRLRRFVPQVNFHRWFKLLVTVLATRMIALPLM